MPTVLDLAGIEIPAAVQGTSLLPRSVASRLDLLALAETWYPRYHYGWSELTAVRDGRSSSSSRRGASCTTWQSDPGEQHDIAAADPARADALERGLRALLAATTRSDAVSKPRRP